MPENRAAWVPALHAKNLDIKSAPYPKPKAAELLVKGAAVAVNPIDWILMDKANISYPWIKFPFVFGSDVAGEVVEIGSKVTRFKVGDRVTGFACGSSKKYNTSTMSAFQTYVVLGEHMASKIPDSMPYESAAVIPLCFSTASCSLFQDDQLNLKKPTTDPKPTGETLIVWGGSTSVGTNAIQLAVAAGYEVITTCSPRNFEYVKRLGATQAFDYNDKTVVSDIIKAFNGRKCAGAITVGDGAADACLDIMPKVQGNRFISMATYPVKQDANLPSTILHYISWNVQANTKAMLRGVKIKYIFGDTLESNGIGKYMFEDFLQPALAKGMYKPSPEPQVVGEGLESLQKALEAQKKGVSAKKLVVSL